MALDPQASVHLVKDLLTIRCEHDRDSASLVERPTLDESACFHAVEQSHGAVVAQLHTLGEVSDARGAVGITFDRQQHLVVLWW